MPSNSEELEQDQPKTDVPVKKPKAKSAKTDKVAETETDKLVKPAVSDRPVASDKSVEDSKPPTLEKATAEKPVVVASSSASGSGVNGDGMPPKGSWKRPAMMVASVVLGLAVVVIVVFGILIYGYKSDNAAVKAVAMVVPYPVQRVNGHFVSYNDYLFEVEANERAYQNNAKLNNQPAVDFNSASGKKLATQIKQHSMTTLETNALVAQLAAQKNVKVTDAQVNNLINQLYQRYGGQATLLKTLNQIYGWNLNDLKRVVRQQLLQQNLQTAVTSDPAASAAAKQQAENVISKLKGGSDFATLAKQDSQASDASTGGDMGSFTKAQVPAAVWTAASALQAGQVSDPVKVSGGYVVLKVVTKNSDGSIHAQEILINTVDFNTYMAQKMKAAKVNVYLKV